MNQTVRVSDSQMSSFIFCNDTSFSYYTFMKDTVIVDMDQV